MTRRHFLHAATTVAAGATLAPPRVLAAASASVPAVDTHIHLYDPTRPQGVPWPPKNDPVLYQPHRPEKFAALASAHQVVGAIIVEASEWVEDNQWILELAREHPLLVGVVGQLRPAAPDFAAHLRRFAANPLFRGLRIRASELEAAAQPPLRASLGRLVDAGLSLDVVGGAAILAPTDRLAREFPSLRVIVDHLPLRSWDGNLDALRAATAGLAARPNVFVKISDVVRLRDGAPITDPAYYRPALDALLELFGPERIVYGSNWPVSNRVAPYATIHRVVADYFATQGRTVAENYFWRNSRRAYRWEPRGPSAALPR